MTTKTRDPDYKAEKRNNISEINISLNTNFSALGFVYGVLTFLPFRLLLSFIIIYMIAYSYWYNR